MSAQIPFVPVVAAATALAVAASAAHAVVIDTFEAGAFHVEASNGNATTAQQFNLGGLGANIVGDVRQTDLFQNFGPGLGVVGDLTLSANDDAALFMALAGTGGAMNLRYGTFTDLGTPLNANLAAGGANAVAITVADLYGENHRMTFGVRTRAGTAQQTLSNAFVVTPTAPGTYVIRFDQLVVSPGDGPGLDWTDVDGIVFGMGVTSNPHERTPYTLLVSDVRTVVVPEPTSAIALALGVATTLRRRRR